MKIPDDVSETLFKLLDKVCTTFGARERTLYLPIGRIRFRYARINKPNFHNFETKRTQCINNAFHILSLHAYFCFDIKIPNRKKKNKKTYALFLRSSIFINVTTGLVEEGANRFL